MKRTLTLIALVLVSFWACNKQSQELNIPAPVQYSAHTTEYSALQETLAAKNAQALESLVGCSLAIQRANLEHIKQKRVVTAQTSLFPIHNE